MTKRISQISFISVRLNMLAETGASLGTASGFFCLYKGRKALITNWHVVSGCNPITGNAIHRSKVVPAKIEVRVVLDESEGTKSPMTSDLRQCDLVFDLYDDDSKPCWFTHPEFNEKIDVVCIPIDDGDVLNLPLICFDIGVHMEANKHVGLWVMEQVFVVGFPLPEEKTNNPFPIYKSGTIASEPDMYYRNKAPMFYIDGKTKSGMSGSPVVRREGIRFEDSEQGGGVRAHATTLVGVYSGRDRQEKTEFEAELGIVWPFDLCVLPILEVMK